jgi:hypothetical protein
LAHIQEKRGIEFYNPAVANSIGPVQGYLVPVKPLQRVGLVTGYIMGGYTSLEVIFGRLPGLGIESASRVNLPSKLSLSTFNT